MNGEGAEAMFRIQMFKFVGISYKDIFLHCTVQICHNSAAVCKPICTTPTTQDIHKAPAAAPCVYEQEGITTALVTSLHCFSYGPIKRKLADDGETNKDRGEFTPVETWILGGVLMAFLVLTGVFGALLLKSRRAYPPIEPQLIISYFHNSEAAS
nr:pancreatic secretory granule membrane major glycoprotein GP2-like [Pelodiscus sinensis]|eukprot:XP_025039881.1 pancreatic secretory granule membrane major glycoprotein GP2-like [Pelodiscus sinensis]